MYCWGKKKKKEQQKSKGWKVAFEWTKEKIGCQG